MVYVFDHTASRLVEQVNALDKSVIDRGTILGYAMAHEIGHILLHLTGHSPSGVMKAKWSVEDMREMSSGRLNFHPSQAAEMQAEVRRRMRDQQITLSLIAAVERQTGAAARQLNPQHLP